MQLNLKLSHKGLILIVVPLAFEAFALGSLYAALQGAEKEIARESYAKNVVTHMNSLIELTVSASTSLAFYRTALDPVFLRRYRQAIDEIHGQFDALHELLKGRPAELKAMKPLQDTVERVVMYMEEARLALESGDNARQMQFLLNIKSFLRQISDEVEKSSTNYRKLVESAPQHEAARRELIKMSVLLLIVASAVLAALLVVYFNRDTTSRLKVLMDNTGRFARGEQLASTLTGADEIAALDGVFHEMADTITEQARQKQEFVAMITHDMRSPLTAVLNSLSMISAGIYGEGIPEQANEEIKTCETSLERIVRLINDLLDAEKLAAGKMDMHFARVNLADVLHDSIQSIRPLAETKQITLSTPELEIEITADGDRLIQVLVNLTSNAIKFSPEKSEISISVQKVGDWVETRITDEGPGIPAEDCAHLFQRFKQVKSVSRRIKGGTGLGLAICKDIIEQHHGKIGVESEVGKGSTFWFRIPVEQAPET